MKVLKILFWTAIILLSILFYSSNALPYLDGYRNPRFGDQLFTNQFWFVVHILGASCSLFLGPVQFWKFARVRFTKYHRIAGKIYIFGSLAAAVSAMRLSFFYSCIGCRYSLFILSCVFLFTTAAAWYAIKQRNIVAHQQFMVRSYTAALAFVFVRLDSIIPMDFIFGNLKGEQLDIVVEWIFSFVPLMLVELFMIWLPSLRRRQTQVV